MDLIVRELGSKTDKSYPLDELTACDSKLPITKDGQLELIFVTGNENKIKELKQLIQDLTQVTLSILNVDLPEIQASDVLDVVAEKCRAAYRHVVESRPNQNAKPIVLIEDTSLNFEALNGMPGPYIKWFIKAIGVEGLPKMLSGFSNNNAQAECVFALMARPEEIIFCRGLVDGRIVKARGGSWGWDPVFEEKISCKTFGELDAETKQLFSHRSKAVYVLKQYLLSRNK